MNLKIIFKVVVALWLSVFSGIVFSQENNSTFVSQIVPTAMQSGKVYEVSVTFLNSGSTAWSENFFLGSQNPTDNWNWNNGRVGLNAGEVVYPNSTKIFKFNVTAPANSAGNYKVVPFQWRMLKSGVEWFGESSTNTNIGVFFAPNIITKYPRRVAPVVVSPNDFTSKAFFGANVLMPSDKWIPTADEMVTIADAAAGMNLNVIRLNAFLNFTGISNSVVRDEKVNESIKNARNVMDIAYARGYRVVMTLNGYLKYNSSCGFLAGFTATENDIAKFVRGVYNHPGLMAWDLVNEPMWSADTTGCLKNGLADYQDVVDGVHAMYNLVRANDPGNKPTTVGDAKGPFMKYWNDISSFASPHLYVLDAPNPDLRTLQGAAFAEIKQYKLEVGSLPLVIGEFGFSTPGDFSSEEARSEAYQKIYDLTKEGGYNIGTMFWNLTTTSEPGQQALSPISPSGFWKPVANVISQQVPMVRNAEFVSQSIPAVMTHGQLYNVTITMKNTGTTVWSQRSYKLGAQNPGDNMIWNDGRVLLSSSPLEAVLPMQQKTFSFTVKAPSSVGNYNFQWKMLQEAVEWFGEVTPNIVVSVR